ncbi:MAG: AAA family ATPase [Clostridia bacterium]
MIILIGESGSGKTTILNELEKRGFEKAINHTTRKPRDGEETLKEYEFVTKEEFEEMWKKGKLVQRAEFNGEYYGISTESLKDNVACILIVDSIQDIKDRILELGLNGINIQSFYIHVPVDERTKRMLKRGDNIESIQRKIQIDKEKFKEAREVADFVIENNEIEETVEKIITLSNLVSA